MNFQSEPRQRAKTAFTLIELLVVVAIMSLLAAILFPVFARVRENSRRTSCSSNQKQLALGILQYTTDWDERFPVGRITCDGYLAGVSWGGAVYPYVKSTQVYACPSDTTKKVVSRPTFNVVSYAFNSNLVIAPKQHGTVNKLAMAGLTAPAVTVMICESRDTLTDVTQFPEPVGNNTSTMATNGIWAGDDMPSDCAYGPFDYDKATLATGWMGREGSNRYSSTPVGSAKIGDETGRHLDGANFAFTDGHVKWMLGNRVSSGQNANLPTDPQQPDTAASNVRAAGTSGTDDPPFAATFSAR